MRYRSSYDVDAEDKFFLPLYWNAPAYCVLVQSRNRSLSVTLQTNLLILSTAGGGYGDEFRPN